MYVLVQRKRSVLKAFVRLGDYLAEKTDLSEKTESIVGWVLVYLGAILLMTLLVGGFYFRDPGRLFQEFFRLF